MAIYAWKKNFEIILWIFMFRIESYTTYVRHQKETISPQKNFKDYHLNNICPSDDLPSNIYTYIYIYVFEVYVYI